MKTYFPRKKIDFQVIDNIQDLCRLCLNKCINGIPIYPDAQSEAQPILATKIMMCAGIEVPRNEDLSNQVCIHCINEIDTIYAFRKVCETAYQRIKLHLHASQQAKYMLKNETLPKDLESNENICKETVNTTENMQSKDVVTFQNVEMQDASNLERIEPVQETIGTKQNISSDESEQTYQNTFLDPNTGKLEIIDDYESKKNLEDLEIKEPVFETHPNNEFNQNHLNLENMNNINVNNNLIDLSKAYEVIENNALTPKVDLPNNCKNISETNYLKQVYMTPSLHQNDALNRIYLIKAKETVDNENATVVENTDTISTSNLNHQTQNNDVSSQEVEKTNITEVMSDFIISRLLESGLIKMEGDAIATCGIGTMQLETGNGDVINMEIVEESLRKTNKIIRSKKPEAHTCDTCGLVVKSASSLRRHAMKHSGIRRHQCEVCPRAFAQPYTLQRHVTTHHAVRPFPCPSCPASFSQRSSMLAHKRTHERDHSITLHQCLACDAAYAHASGLTRHVKSRHLGTKVRCPACSKELADDSSLKRHQLMCSKTQASTEPEAKVLDVESVGHQQDVNLDSSQT